MGCFSAVCFCHLRDKQKAKKRHCSLDRVPLQRPMISQHDNWRGSGQCMAIPPTRALSGHNCGEGLVCGGSGSAVLQVYWPDGQSHQNGSARGRQGIVFRERECEGRGRLGVGYGNGISACVEVRMYVIYRLARPASRPIYTNH